MRAAVRAPPCAARRWRSPARWTAAGTPPIVASVGGDRPTCLRPRRPAPPRRRRRRDHGAVLALSGRCRLSRLAARASARRGLWPIAVQAGPFGTRPRVLLAGPAPLDAAADRADDGRVRLMLGVLPHAVGWPGLGWAAGSTGAVLAEITHRQPHSIAATKARTMGERDDDTRSQRTGAGPREQQVKSQLVV